MPLFVSEYVKVRQREGYILVANLYVLLARGNQSLPCAYGMSQGSRKNRQVTRLSGHCSHTTWPLVAYRPNTWARVDL